MGSCGMLCPGNLPIPFSHSNTLVHLWDIDSTDVHTHTHTHTDSPGVPVSATSKELFRGFSYVDPTLMDEERRASLPAQGPQSTVHMSTVSQCVWVIFTHSLPPHPHSSAPPCRCTPRQLLTTMTSRKRLLAMAPTPPASVASIEAQDRSMPSR